MTPGLVTVAVILGLAALGFFRGVKAEGLSLAGLLGAATVLNHDGMDERLIGFVNKIPTVLEVLLAPDGSVSAAPLEAPAGAPIDTPDDRLVFALILFLVGAAVSYGAGSVFGGPPSLVMERLSGVVLGGANGFAMATALLNFSSQYSALHPDAQPFAIEVPATIAPTLPESNFLLPYVPLVFITSVALMSVMAFSAFMRGRQR
jgi:hypothetical protein